MTVTFSCSSWGASSEKLQDIGPKELLRIIEEVDRCRPYFIGLLGEGYGTVPSVVEGGLECLTKEAGFDQHPWLRKTFNPHVLCGLRQSLTELEFAYGCLCTNWEAPDNTLLYLRDPAFALQQTNPKERAQYLPRTRAGMSLKQSKLAAHDLKMRVRTAGIPCQKYKSPEVGVEMILSDVYKMVNAVFPRENVPTEVYRSSMLVASLKRAHERIFNATLFEKELVELEKCLTLEKTNLILIKGVVGSGKSTFAFQVL